MKKTLCLLLAALMIALALTLAACSEEKPQETSPAEGTEAPAQTEPQTPADDAAETEPEPAAEPEPQAEEPAEAEAEAQTPAEPEPPVEQSMYATEVAAGAEPVSIEKGLTLVRVEDCGFSAFLSGGGASSDQEMLTFLFSMLKVPSPKLDFELPGIGCSTIAATTPEGGRAFGRNFDWSCNNVILLEAHPSDGYASFSTVNTDFITEAARTKLADDAMAAASYYAPLDGMNEKGLCISVNMISDSARIQQRTDLPDLTTTTAVRLLLDRAATVDEAIELLKSYDLHGSYDMMIHFAISDAAGRAVAVEYVDQQLHVTETPILTNFYVTEGSKYGIGAEESHRRFEALEKFVSEHETATIYEVREALMAAKESDYDNDPSERTEWSVVYDQTNLAATWYRRERFEEGWTVKLVP